MPPLYLGFDTTARSANTLVVKVGFGKNYIQSVYFRSNAKSLRASGDVLFCLGLLPAMELGVDLIIDQPVDGALLDNSENIQSLIGEWYPWYERISIIAEREQSNYPSNRGTGLFYSGGVDSSFSLAEEAERLDALVTIRGIDAGINTSTLAATLSGNLNHVATEFDLEPIEIETNIRDVFDRLIGWEEYHGSQLAAVRHMLADHLEVQLIAASDFEACRTRQWGSHPDLDPLFATKDARIEVHGLVDRITKIKKIANDPRLLDCIKVCYKSDVNCGICGKCTFAMDALDVIGRLDQAHTFPREKLGQGKFHIVDDSILYDFERLRELALNQGNRQTLIERLDTAMQRYKNQRNFSRYMGSLSWKPRFKRLKRRLRYNRKARRTRFVRAPVP